MTATFAGLGLHADLVAALARQGITEPFAIQELTIADALAGRDVLGKAKTGSGKTLAFGLPAARPHRQGRAPPARAAWSSSRPVSWPPRSPTRSARSARSATARSGPSTAACRWTRRSTALQKGVDVVVGTPGRLIDLIERGSCRSATVEVLVVDEADRMADMGFMPQVQKILYGIKSDAPDDAVLRHARRRGEAPRRPLHGRPGVARGRARTSPPSTRWTTCSSPSTRWTR